MNTRERKIKQRIARRKEKVQRMIGEQEALLAALDSVIFCARMTTGAHWIRSGASYAG